MPALPGCLGMRVGAGRTDVIVGGERTEPVPAPAPADAYAAPFREPGEPRAAAGQVVHRARSCACTADGPRGHSWPPPAGVPAALPAACVHAPGLSYLLRFRPGRGLHCSQDELPLRRARSCPQISSPGTLGEEGWETWGGSCGELMAPQISKSLHCMRTRCKPRLKLLLKVMTR